jgi:GNAT superfamily N-acetyltransferase
MEKIIYEDKADDIVIEVTFQRPQEMIELLENMLWGTNGPIYSKTGIAEKVHNTKNMHSILLKKSGKIIGICGLSERTVKIGNQWVTGHYVRNFAVDKAYQGKSYSKLLMEHLKQYFISILPEPYVGYAIIEGSNIRSQKVADFLGYPIVRKFETLLFSRLFPKRQTNVRRAAKNEHLEIKNKLTEFYKDYSFVQFDNTFFKEDYFVVEENGEMIAGVQAFKVQWKVHAIRGFSGKIMMNVLPYIPIANRLFRPDFKFLVFDSMFCKAGKEATLLTLLEDVLSRFGDVYSGWVMLDQEAPLYKKLNKINKWGILNAIQSPFPASVVMNVHGLPESVLDEAKQQPAYIAGFDCI